MQKRLFLFRYVVSCSCMVVFVSILGCVTINVVFPAAEVREAADKIVGDIRSKELEQQPPPPPQSFRLQKRLFLWQLPVAFAAVNIDITTPAIRTLKTSLQQRFSQLKPYFEKGIVGETNKGLVEIRSLEGLPLQEQAQVRQLVKEQNAERQKLYAELAKANGLASSTIPQIQSIFAESWQKAAESGWWIQKDNGEWVKK